MFFKTEYEQAIKKAMDELAAKIVLEDEKRQNIKIFKDIIKGFFDDWVYENEAVLTNDKYCLWTYREYESFKDYKIGSYSKEPFLIYFNDQEKKVIWDEIQEMLKRKKRIDEETRKFARHLIFEEMKVLKRDKEK